MIKVKGLFEIHITVNTNNGYYPLWKYTHDKKDLKIILAVSENGDYKDQYMISKWKNGNYQEVLDKTNQIVNDMKLNNIDILRVKIESMAHNDGVPYTEEQFNQFIQNKLTGKVYFEYHAKVDLNNNSYDKFNKWCNNQNSFKENDIYIANSVNICGSKIPLLTIRCYNHGRQIAEFNKNLLLDDLKNFGFKIIGNIQQEFSLYDTFDNLDKNWLT